MCWTPYLCLWGLHVETNFNKTTTPSHNLLQHLASPKFIRAPKRRARRAKLAGRSSSGKPGAASSSSAARSAQLSLLGSHPLAAKNSARSEAPRRAAREEFVAEISGIASGELALELQLEKASGESMESMPMDRCESLKPGRPGDFGKPEVVRNPGS